MTPAPTARDWYTYFEVEAQRPEYGTFDKFDDIPPQYVNDTDELKKKIIENNLETLLLIPGPEGTVRLLHNCSLDEDQTKVSGIYGLKQHSPMKQVLVSALVKPFVIAATTRADNKPFIPTIEDFKGCTSGAELTGLTGTGTRTIDELESSPVSFWLHPHLLGAYVTQRQVKIDIIGESYAVAIKGMSDEAATLITQQYYNLLVFIWAVANGYAHTSIKLSDPPDDDATDDLLQRTQHKFNIRANTNRHETGQGHDSNDDGNVPPKDDEESESNTGRNRRPVGSPSHRGRSESPRRSSRRDTNQGRSNRRSRSRSPSKTRSRSQPRGRKRSRSSSSDSQGRGHRRRGNRDRSSSRRGRDRSPNDRDVLHQLTRGVSALAQAQNDNLQKDRAELSALGKLSERQKDLFTLLAAKDWYDTRPKLNRATERLLSSRVPEKQWNLIEDWSRKWPGLVSKQGVVQFLSSGYASKNLPGGFTVFMFSPLKHRRPTDKKDRVRNIKGTFGKEGE
jgi:hypothetical protein